MPEQKKKGRTLFIGKYLMDHTDEEHPISTNDLITVCEERGFSTNRDTIRDDLALLSESDYDLIETRMGKGKGYYIGARLFELSELKMLVDAVSSSRFITVGKSEELIEKITKLTNEQNRGALTARVFTSERIKTSNHSVIMSIDRIFKAMGEGVKIRFHYWNYNQRKEHILRNNGDWLEASPYALLWDDDRYYLAAYSDYRGKVVTYRVDRMCDVEETNEKAVKDDGFNPSEYARSAFRMIDDDMEETVVTLVCDNTFMQNVVDRFGEGVETEVVDEDTFKAFVPVHPSRTFFSWIVGFYGGIRITGPWEVKMLYEEMLRSILKRQG